MGVQEGLWPGEWAVVGRGGPLEPLNSERVAGFYGERWRSGRENGIIASTNASLNFEPPRRMLSLNFECRRRCFRTSSRSRCTPR